MTYARARLWLGISGVGSLVTVCFIALWFGLPQTLLTAEQTTVVGSMLQLGGVATGLMVWLAPFDFLGGYWLPKRFGKPVESFANWFVGYLSAAVGQSILFVVFGMLILAAGSAAGLPGAALAIFVGIAICFVIRNRILLARRDQSAEVSDRLTDALAKIQSWQIFIPRTIVVNHRDIGFTGGVIGFGKYSQIVIPKRWVSTMSSEELATAIARRAIAIESGGYLKGVVMAIAWNAAGFLLCASLPGAGVEAVNSFVTTICAFTIWSFLGLLILPTFSRNASLQIDQLLAKKGTPRSLIFETANTMDQMQDGEPERPKWIERIFHPVPSVSRRDAKQEIRGFAAWNVARTTLFLSWACFGMLSRAVHCNVGRPELWTMLPTD
jgi:hypothetical protein